MRGFERVRSRSAILAKCARFAAKNARRAILPLGFFGPSPLAVPATHREDRETRVRSNALPFECSRGDCDKQRH